MQRFKVRAFILALVLSLSASVSLLLRHSHTSLVRPVDIKELPLEIEEWEGEDFEIEEATRNILETESILIRDYRRDGQTVTLAIVYYADSLISLHLPESCSVGHGSYITERTVFNTGQHDSFSVNELDVERDSGKQVIMYYFQTMGLKTASYRNFRWHMLLQRLNGNPTCAGLIRFSAPVTTDVYQCRAILRSFIEQMHSVITDSFFGGSRS